MLTHARAFLFLCIHLLLLFLVTAEQAQPPLTMSFTTPTHGFHLLETRASSTGGQLLATTKAAVPPLLILKDGTLVCPRGPDEQRLLAHLQSILAEKHTNDARQPTVAATVRLLEALIQQSSLLPSPKKNDDSPFDLQQLLHISPSLVTSIDAGGIATACQDFHAHPRLISSAGEQGEIRRGKSGLFAIKRRCPLVHRTHVHGTPPSKFWARGACRRCVCGSRLLTPLPHLQRPSCPRSSRCYRAVRLRRRRVCW